MDRDKLEAQLDGVAPLVYEDVTGSTNDDAKRLLAAGTEPLFLVVAGEQTAGRGRRGSPFISPRGGVYMSLVVPAPNEGLELVTSFVAVCVCGALEETCGLQAGIKWVNDIYIDNRKLVGILAELFGDCLVIGMGINGLTTPNLLDNVQATSLAEYIDDPDLELLCANITQRLVVGLRKGIDASETVDFCRGNSLLLGHEIVFELKGTRCHGIAHDLAKDGSLLVDMSDRRVVLTSACCNVRIVGRC